MHAGTKTTPISSNLIVKLDPREKVRSGSKDPGAQLCVVILIRFGSKDPGETNQTHVKCALCLVQVLLSS